MARDGTMLSEEEHAKDASPLSEQRAQCNGPLKLSNS